MSIDLSPVIIKPDATARHSVIWMHGLGADAHDFEPIVPELRLPKELAVRFIFPNAPRRPITINGGMTMPGWYDILDMDLPRRVDTAGVEESHHAISALIDAEIAQGISSQNIVIAGFSQGGAMALHTGLRFPQPLGGIMALSCYLLLADQLDAERHPANQNTPIFMAHGRFDEVVPLHYGKAGHQQLEQLGYPVQWRDYPMPHSVHPQEISDIAAWLRQVLDSE